MPLLEVRDLRTYYFTYRGVVKAVDGISFEVEKGKTLGLAGESGCGKSTAAYSIIKLVPPPGRIVGGQIIFDGMDLTKMSESEIRRKIRWKRISMVFQGAMNALTPVYTIAKQITEVLTYHAGMSKTEALQRAAELLEMVGLDRTVLRRYPHELSGGMKQRAFIAMALALNPDLVIADEPTTALDVVVQAQILNLLKRLQKELGIGLILITHDLAVTAEMSDYVAVMYAGKIVEYGPNELIFREPLHPYSEGLIMSVPSLRRPRKVKWIPGLPPDLIEPPKGCRFHPRCSRAMDICREKEPPMVEVKGRKVACWLYAR
ncbi:ABC transporter ATP-binding protein [Candidatus Bathyarchaeota archaeon]|nr:MAG: ABC transporter ATP-binding protein [Candidatus Bathyarchaeota archaeon]